MLKTDLETYRAWILLEIRKDYKKMLESGSTATWETEDGAAAFDNAGSLCHGWTAGVLSFFVRTILGIKPVTPGCKKIQVKPNLLGLTSVEGCVPTLYGEIYVKHTMQNGEIISEIKAPEGVEICKEETELY